MTITTCARILFVVTATGTVTLQALAFDRPLIFGCGLIYARWVNRPWSYDGQSMDRIVEMGGTRTSASFDWVDIEPQPGVWAWDYMDHVVAEGQARGLVQFAYIGNTAIWALPPGVPPEHSYRHPPDESKVAEFQNFCRQVASRYRGKINHYMFWNEPNGCSWVNDGCANSNGYPLYVRWLKRAYVALKEGNPDCKVAAGMLDYNEGVTQGWQYVAGMYAEGAKGYFDAISIHPYAAAGIHWNAIRDTRAVMVQNGDGHKSIWIDEYGWPNSGAADAPGKLTAFFNEITKPQYHYVYTANYLVITDLPGTTQYGLCDRNLNRRPIWYAFRDYPKNIATNTPTPTGPTPTPSNTPTATPTRTPRPDGNLLLNPDFEDGAGPAPPQFQDDPAYPRTSVADWQLWGSNWWKVGGQNGNVAYNGLLSQAVGTNWGKLDNAVYQRAQVEPGRRYRFTIHTRADSPATSGQFLSHWAAVDLNGGTNPEAAGVLKTTPTFVEETWREHTIEFEATGSVVTVFARGKTAVSNGWQWFYADYALLVPVPPSVPSPPGGILSAY